MLGIWSVVIVVNGLGEEIGWRGYALPRLQTRFGALVATAIVTAGWATWHVPQFFFLRSYQDFKLAMLPMFLVGLGGGAIVMTWLYNRTGSILSVAIYHGLYNVTGATQAATNGSGFIAAAEWTFVVGSAAILLALEWRAHRTGAASVLGPPVKADRGDRPHEHPVVVG